MDAVLMNCHPTEALALGLPRDMPQVLLFHHSPDFPCVCADDSGGIKLAVEHLLSLGHRNVSYLASPELDSISPQRVLSYHTALQEAGYPPGEENVKFLSNHHSLGFRKSGEVTMEAWLQEGWSQLGCTAILAHNDDAGIGIVKALTKHGLRVPEDVSVIGFDGTEISELCTLPLTTVKVPLQEIGEQAVKVLLGQMKNGVPSNPQKITLPVQLKLGESTAPVHQILSRSNSKE
jgi:LacI family transcriptional regulator